jgi:hypothetical protein
MEQTTQIDLHPAGWAGLLGTFWCRHFHASVMWPIHGQYRCRECYRLYSVPWQRGEHMHTQPDLGVAVRC